MKNQVVLAVLAALATAPLAASAASNSQGQGQKLSALDKQYLIKTSQSNMAELMMSPMVLKYAPDPQDKQFAQRMIHDHSKNEKMDQAVAAEVGVQLPSGTSSLEKGVMRRLAHERPAKFLSAYRMEMIRDHRIDIAQTRREISLGHNTKVREFAEETLPVLQTHLQLAQGLPTSAQYAQNTGNGMGMSGNGMGHRSMSMHRTGMSQNGAGMTNGAGAGAAGMNNGAGMNNRAGMGGANGAK